MQAPEQVPQQRPHGFQRGKSGNPAGRLSNAARQQRIEAKARELAAEFGGWEALSAVDRLLLTQAAALVLRRPKSAEDVVRVSNAIARLVSQVADKRREPEAEEFKPALPNVADLMRRSRNGE